MRAFLLIVGVLTPPAVTLAAQDASPYVPLSHWAMPYLEHLISAGVVADPTPLTRPLKRRDVVAALAGLDTTAVSARARPLLRRLLRDFQPALEPPRYRVEQSFGAVAATDALRDPLELDRGIPPRRIDRRAFGSVGLDAELSFGPFVAASHPVVDTRLQFDPDWYGRADNATRFAEAYVGAQSRYAEVFFGILDRNWGPSVVQGVLLSANPYSMDHVALALGTRRLQLQGFATQLDTRLDTTAAPVNRYMEQHRLWIRPPGRWTLALWEGGVWSGVGRQAEPWYLNLATLTYFRAGNTSTNVNSFWGMDFEHRLGGSGGATLFGQFMLDDIQVSRNALTDLKPVSYAFTVGAKGGLAGGTASWTAFYTQVATLTYRNEDDLQVPLYHGLGTGRNFDDYDQATAKLAMLIRPALLAGPEVTVLRQGAADPRQAHPLPPQYPATPVILSGIVQRTVRLALDATWQAGGLSITANGGVHLLHNAAHSAGASKTEWVGAIAATYRIHHESGVP